MTQSHLSRDGKLPDWGKVEIPERVQKRAATQFILTDDGCHVSTYSVASHGYAQIGWNENGGHFGTTAHRAAWVYANGEQIPLGMTVDHICKNRLCVNPDHLRLLGNFENARRTAGRDWKMGECVNGHPNSEIYWDGSRHKCLPCDRESKARYRKRHPKRVLEADRRYREKKRSKSKESGTND